MRVIVSVAVGALLLGGCGNGANVRGSTPAGAKAAAVTLDQVVSIETDINNQLTQSDVGIDQSQVAGTNITQTTPPKLTPAKVVDLYNKLVANMPSNDPYSAVSLYSFNTSSPAFWGVDAWRNTTGFEFMVLLDSSGNEVATGRLNGSGTFVWENLLDTTAPQTCTDFGGCAAGFTCVNPNGDYSLNGGPGICVSADDTQVASSNSGASFTVYGLPVQGMSITPEVIAAQIALYSTSWGGDANDVAGFVFDPATLQSQFASTDVLKRFLAETTLYPALKNDADRYILDSNGNFNPANITLTSLGRGDVFGALQTWMQNDGVNQTGLNTLKPQTRVVVSALLAQPTTVVYQLSGYLPGTDDDVAALVAINTDTGLVMMLTSFYAAG